MNADTNEDSVRVEHLKWEIEILRRLQEDILSQPSSALTAEQAIEFALSYPKIEQLKSELEAVQTAFRRARLA